MNAEDEVIGAKEEDQLAREDIYRVSALWLTNPRGEILLARRSLSKVHDPGKWGPAAAGTVRVGESYYDCMVREAANEIGLEDLEFRRLYMFRRSHKYNYFCQWYSAVVDRRARDFRIKPQEVDQVRWFNRPDLEKDIEENPGEYLTAMGMYLDLFK